MNQDQFLELAQSGYNRIPVVREVLADTETPLSIYLKLGKGLHSYFFESVQGGEKWGRYSIIGLPCQTVLKVVGDKVSVETNGEVVEELQTENPFAFIAEFKERFRVADAIDGQRFTGGLVGYFGYDTVRYVETSVGSATGIDEIETPEILLMLSEEVVVFDNLRGTISFVINVDPSSSNAFSAAHSRLDFLESQLEKSAPLPPTQSSSSISEADFAFHFKKEEYERAVNIIKDYIVAGDVMQVVLAQRMSIDFSGEPLNVYRALRFLNPSPYMVYFDLGDHYVVSASPEILARVEEGKITVRPLAGTRKRGSTETEDLALEEELLADAKELAEHLMLIDLSRNDSGRVSKTGSVTVPKKMFVERYSHVMHIASIVESEMLDDKTALDVLQATLPVGTLSGAPKVRAMEIIDELEPEKRGIYGGAMGYLAWNGNMDMAIAIRTSVIKNGKLYVQAGAGIVADSIPEMEWEETLNKARAIVRAVQLAGNSLAVD
ncbi:MAG: anthranilate synthase component I [Gammaproteobacteria bacterium]|jgi:anthranilate synthase component 1|nr:anthranilate synthase component I [Gammaproteobacteria bacterium]MDP6098038.1 anthranilate synthase component I [Gammaproteobacteria bacterium]MDP7455984.1 anthranilate synthase component I [Gammaproteobacteria bacterium]HJO12104.1 anthranilate synthase component I [Gammaproteobacteria bacterium]